MCRLLYDMDVEAATGFKVVVVDGETLRSPVTGVLVPARRSYSYNGGPMGAVVVLVPISLEARVTWQLLDCETSGIAKALREASECVIELVFFRMPEAGYTEPGILAGDDAHDIWAIQRFLEDITINLDRWVVMGDTDGLLEDTVKPLTLRLEEFDRQVEATKRKHFGSQPSHRDQDTYVESCKTR